MVCKVFGEVGKPRLPCSLMLVVRNADRMKKKSACGNLSLGFTPQNRAYRMGCDIWRKRLNSFTECATMLAAWEECINSRFNVFDWMSILLLIAFVGSLFRCC